MASLPGNSRNTAHEGAADAEDMDMHKEKPRKNGVMIADQRWLTDPTRDQLTRYVMGYRYNRSRFIPSFISFSIKP
jgi:hypothetical protein